MKKLLSALFLLALCSSLAGASVPDPLNCTVAPLMGNPLDPSSQVAFLSPGAINGTSITITVRNNVNALIPNASVVVTFNSEIGICSDAVHSGSTGASGPGLGQCVITLKGGGCQTAVLGACVVTANGIEIRNLQNVRSPDNEGHTSSVPNGKVNSQDLGAFADEFIVGPAGCHDYDLLLGVNSQDLGLFGDAFSLTAGIPPLPVECTLLP
jgi:hypothetical protein